MKRAGVLPERRGFKSVCDGSGRTSAVKADIRNPLRYSVKKQAACDSKNRGRPLWLFGR